MKVCVCDKCGKALNSAYDYLELSCGEHSYPIHICNDCKPELEKWLEFRKALDKGTITHLNQEQCV